MQRGLTGRFHLPSVTAAVVASVQPIGLRNTAGADVNYNAFNGGCCWVLEALRPYSLHILIFSCTTCFLNLLFQCVSFRRDCLALAQATSRQLKSFVHKFRTVIATGAAKWLHSESAGGVKTYT